MLRKIVIINITTHIKLCEFTLVIETFVNDDRLKVSYYLLKV